MELNDIKEFIRNQINKLEKIADEGTNELAVRDIVELHRQIESYIQLLVDVDRV